MFCFVSNVDQTMYEFFFFARLFVINATFAVLHRNVQKRNRKIGHLNCCWFTLNKHLNVYTQVRSTCCKMIARISCTWITLPDTFEKNWEENPRTKNCQIGKNTENKTKQKKKKDENYKRLRFLNGTKLHANDFNGEEELKNTCALIQ